MIEWSVRHKSIVFLLCICILVFGFGMYPYMEMQENPEVSSPISTVTCVYPGASPEDVEKDIIKPIEDKLNEISEIKTMESFCMDNVGIVKVTLIDMSDDEISETWDDLKDKVDEISDLPEAAYEPKIETDFTSSYGYIIGIYSDKYDYEQLKDVSKKLEDELSMIDGVKAVDTDGKINKEIDINLDLIKLEQYGISPADIGTYIKARNVNIPGGSFELGSIKIPVEITGQYNNIEEIKNTIIGMSTETGNTVYLKDVAEIEETYGDDSMRATVNNKKGVIVGVKFTEGINIPRVMKSINRKIDEFKETELYNDMEMTVLTDQSIYIDNAINLLRDNLISAVILVLLVVIVSMGIRSAFIVALPIPIVIGFVFVYMDLTEIPLHQVSIMSLIISLSLLVANGIVSNDNMNVYLERGEDKFTSCTKGVKEVKLPILTSTLTTVASFLPLAMMVGSAGKFVKTLPILVSVALIASYFTSLTVVPAMGHLLLLDKEKREKKAAKRHRKNNSQHKSIINRIYEGILRICLKIPVITVIAFIGLFIFTLTFVPELKKQLFPPVEREQYIIDVSLQEGSTTDKTAEAVNNICKILDEDKSIINYGSEIGTGFMKYYVTFMSNQQATNKAQILVNGSKNSINDIEKKIGERIPGVIVNFKELEYAVPVDHPIEVRVSGDNIDRLMNISEKIKEKLRGINGCKNIEDNIGTKGYKLNVNVNEEKANMVGITNYDVASTVRMAINGTEVTQLKQKDIEKDPISIVMKIPENETKDSSSLSNIFVTSQITKEHIPLKQIADIETKSSLKKIMRRNTKRTITIGMYTEKGYDSDKILKEIKDNMQDIELPFGYDISYGGEQAERTDTFKGMVTPAIIAIIIIYLIISIQFGDLIKPLIIMGTIPLSFIGVIAGLKIMNYPIGFMALLGGISLMGVVVNNGIVILDYIDMLVKERNDFKEAIVEASVTRLRPIMIGMITTIISLLPLVSTGGSLWAPMAASILYGMFISSILTMLIIPCSYSFIIRKAK